MKTINIKDSFTTVVGVFICLLLASHAAAQDKKTKLRVGDRIYVEVVGETITGEYEVSRDGTFQMRYLEDPVPAEGETPDQVQKILMAMLVPDYLLKPQVIVTLLDRKKLHCAVIGQVGSPRVIQFDPDDGLTLFEAIGQAGDLTQVADKEKIEVTRNQKIIKTPMPKSKMFKIERGDTINVPILPPLGTYTLTGYVRRQATFAIPRGEKHSLMWAIDNGGGILGSGTLKRVTLRRDEETRQLSGEKELEAIEVKPGDQIKIGQKLF